MDDVDTEGLTGLVGIDVTAKRNQTRLSHKIQNTPAPKQNTTHALAKSNYTAQEGISKIQNDFL